MRLLLGLAFVVVLAGCGAETGGPGVAPVRQSVPAAPAPPIVALDEAPPAEVTRMLDEEFAPLPVDSGLYGAAGPTSVIFMWGVDVQDAGGTSAPTPAQIAEARRQFEAHREALVPAPGSRPRAVARLPLADGGDTLFIVWHNRDGLLCTYTSTSDAGGTSGGAGAVRARATARGRSAQPSASLRAARAARRRSAGSSPERSRPTRALDVTTSDGPTTEYPLTGPVLDGDRRVFLLELGAHDWRKLTLVRGGQLVDETTMPAGAAAAEDCNHKVGPMPMPPAISVTPGPGEQSPAMQAWESSFQACLTASGAFPDLHAGTP